jgi:hypothetical protein
MGPRSPDQAINDTHTIKTQGAWVKADGEDHHVPLEEYSSNLKEIVDHLRSLHAKQRILFITPPPVDDVRRARDLKMDVKRFL